MTNQRESLLSKIRALLSKTVENGCTEQEAMTALNKARAMMDAYEVTEEDLQLTKEESAIIKEASKANDKHSIRYNLCGAVARFTDTGVWVSSVIKNRNAYRRTLEKRVVFCGLPSDVDFAEWLLDTLESFVQSELVNYLAMNDWGSVSNRRRTINSFVQGCTIRLINRLDSLTKESKTVATSNSNALVVIKSAAITDKMKADGIKLSSGNYSGRRGGNDSAYAAGKSAGDRASLGRPIGGGTKTYLS